MSKSRKNTVAKQSNPVEETQKAIIVLGMHRSGTSAMAGALKIMGLNLGSNLLPPDGFENAKGFWEHLEILQVHEDLLHSMQLRWDHVGPFPKDWWLERSVEPYRKKLIDIIDGDFCHSSFWALKDPRMCRLMPFWLEIFARVKSKPFFVHIIRNPLEVAASLKRRNHFPVEKSLILWALHAMEAEHDTRGFPRVFISFAQLLENWRSSMEKVGKLLNITWPVSFKDAGPEIAGLEKLDNDISGTECISTNLQSS